MKKKILFFMFRLAGGGAERTVVNIMNKLDKNKYEIVLVLGTDVNNDYLHLLAKEIRIENLYCPKLRYCFFLLRKCIVKEQPDLIFTTMNPNNIMAVLAKVSSFKRIPVVVREANNRTESGEVTPVNKILTTLFYNAADKVIALSQGVRDDLTKNFRIQEKKVKVIYNPIDIDSISALKNEKIDDLPKIGGEKLVVSVGRLEEQKDFVTLLQAFRLVVNEVDAKLLILGKGSQEEPLKQLCNSLQLHDSVFFLGFKNNPYKYVKAEDLFVLTSRWEGFGHVIVESMAVGTTVVTTNCRSGPFEILDGDKYGLLAEVGNPQDIAQKMITLLQDNNMRRIYAQKGVERARKFHSKSIVKEYENVFLQVINNRVN